jgi:hypothetical protein
MTASRIDVYDLAFLAGGPGRVVDTAVVVLVESGRLRVASPGELAMVETFRGHPVEAAVLDAVGPRGRRSVDTIRWRLVDDDRINGLARPLAAAGLLRRRLFRGRGQWCATRAGREALAGGPGADRALDGGSAVQVALHGREAMTDAALRSAIFERPAPPQPSAAEIGRRIRQGRWKLETDDPTIRAHGSHTAMGGGAGVGFGDGGGGDGGF